ncbi:MAG: PilZ domain-containing protein [Oscillospiraceae bacterium]|jgi:c-di-GMP-binding flagellar brake protein YcgR|nr:PilZ domain-containing protein [Oscillospiraceae bacterium]
MAGIELKLGERLEILREEKRAVSVIEMITTAGRLVISEPMSGTNRLPVKKDDKLSLYIFRESGMLTCTVTAENIFKERGLVFIEVEIRSKISRYQRRDFVRFDTLLPVSVWPLAGVPNADRLSDAEAVALLADRKLSGAANKDGMIGGFTLDISGGGLRYFSKEMMELGAVGSCEVFLDDGNRVSAAMRIVRCERDLYEGKYIMGAKFIGIEESLRNRIIKYIFAEQLKRRQQEKRLSEEDS